MRMSGFTLERCIQLTKEEIVRASASSANCRALLERFAQIAKPQDGAPLLLLVFARLATIACDWLDGDLFIEMEARRETTRVTVATELGAGMREKVFPSVVLDVPLDEFTRAIERIPSMIHPLVAEVAADHLLLHASARVRNSSIPDEIEIDSALLGSRARGNPPKRQ
jgi:hypothetical protein